MYPPWQSKYASIQEGYLGEHKVRVLRDSVCSGVVVRRDLVKNKWLTRETEMCVIIDGTVRKFPVAKIYVKTPFFTGFTESLCMHNPIYDLIIGNIAGAIQDLLGYRNLTLKMVWLPRQPLVRWDQYIYRQTRLKLYRQEHREKLIPEHPLSEISKEAFTAAQLEDASLNRLRELASPGDERRTGTNNTTKFYVCKGILYRQFNSPKVECGDPFQQLVVPEKFRKHVMILAHESILGGHQGVQKPLTMF